MLDTFMPLDRSSVQTGFDPAFPCNYMPKPYSGEYAGAPLAGVDSFSSYLEQVMGKEIHTDAYASRDAYRSAPVDTESSPYRDVYDPANQADRSAQESSTVDSRTPNAARTVPDSRQADHLSSSRTALSAKRTAPDAEGPETGDALFAAQTASDRAPAKPVKGSRGNAGAAGLEAGDSDLAAGRRATGGPSAAASATAEAAASARQGLAHSGSSPDSQAPSTPSRAGEQERVASSQDGGAASKGADVRNLRADVSSSGLAMRDASHSGAARAGVVQNASLTGEKKPGTEREGRMSTAKGDIAGTETGRDRRKERLEVRLADLRGDRNGQGPSAASREGASGNEALAKATAAGNADAQHSDSSGADIVIRLTGGEAGQGTQAGLRGDQAPLSRPGSFANALAQELRAQYNGDIVRHASIVLKNGGDGLIRLALQPGHLGDVKIQLKIADNNIAARIVVKSEEALKAFESELASLRQAFIDGGFDGASLDLSVSADGAGQGQGGQAGAEEGKQPFYTARGNGAVSASADVPAGAEAASAGYEALSVVEADETGFFAGAVRAGGANYQSGRLRRINMVI